MAKVLVEQSEDGIRSPFLRGILVHSLQDAGLTFNQAHGIANSVRDSIAHDGVINTPDLKKLVADELRGLGLTDVEAVYLGRRAPYEIQVITPEGATIDFSRQEYCNRLKAIGLRTNEAVEIVQRVTNHLLKRRGEPVSSKSIGHLTYRLLRRSRDLGPAVARRWLIWRDFVYSGRPLILLIGGTAGSGKSTLAADLASGLGISRTQSTDLLREVIRSLNSPDILSVSSFNAWQQLSAEVAGQFADDRDELIMEGYRRQSDAMVNAIQAVIQRSEHERVSLIVEGVHLRPSHMVDYEIQDETLIFPVMLAVVKQKRLKERIQGRSTDVPQRRAEHFLNHMDEIWALQSGILSEADTHDVPIILNNDRESVFREIMLALISRLDRDFSRSPEDVFC